ncbi:ABC transporter substrate-binding protein [Brevibacillus fulvus]|uniref:Peptide/nickel transport system substrate-binding protein n=1 Tax=Brevibacillus fulvus TaxID=1125967 RepID=A0A938Y394_9BACL|nr:ABC transporter substrate-binding protein [Brevibacillus fulvus]MBM7591554.1 peptide/nickel transport system substrate-binding protein [Brevibacillus fulvus]
MKRFAMASLALMLLLGVAGCGSQQSANTPQTENSTSKSTQTDSGKKVLTIASGNDIVSFDIHNHNNTSTEAVHVNMFDYLVKKDKNQQLQPDLATSWKQLDDTTWEFKLREGVKFHNGDPFTAADVKYTLERVAKDQTLLEYGNYKQIKEVQVIDDHTVHIITDGPQPVLLNRLSRLGSGMLPSKYIQEKGFDEYLKNPVGTGPYKLKEWKRDDRLILVKNDDYFGDKPKWDEVVFRSIPEDATRVSELLTGGVDLAVNIPPTDLDRIKNNEGTAVAQGPTQRVMQLTVRMTPGTKTADPKVREAIDLAIDKQAIVDNILAGGGTVTRTRVTPGNFGADPSLYGTSLYDPEKAKQLLAEAGYANGLEITLSSPSGRYLKDKETAELIQAMLGEVGIKVNLDLQEWSKFNEQYRGKKMNELFMIAYGNSMFDASLAFDRASSAIAKGETDYNNPELDKLLEEAETNLNEQEREKQYQQAQQMVANDRPFIYLFQMGANYGYNSNRIQFEPRLDEMLPVDEITLKQ